MQPDLPLSPCTPTKRKTFSLSWNESALSFATTTSNSFLLTQLSSCFLFLLVKTTFFFFFVLSFHLLFFLLFFFPSSSSAYFPFLFPHSTLFLFFFSTRQSRCQLTHSQS